jgi:hypothetical protein
MVEGQGRQDFDPATAIGNGGAGYEFTRQEADLRNRIIEHCRWMWNMDRAYAEWAFDWYAATLPWLKLERKK